MNTLPVDNARVFIGAAADMTSLRVRSSTLVQLPVDSGGGGETGGRGLADRWRRRPLFVGSSNNN